MCGILNDNGSKQRKTGVVKALFLSGARLLRVSLYLLGIVVMIDLCTVRSITSMLSSDGVLNYA